jgi:hypothetical protein
MIMPFCEKCGTEVNADAKFCRNCGAKINLSNPPPMQAVTPPPQPAVQPTPAPAAPVAPATDPANQETVLGVLYMRKTKSLGRYDSFNAIFTPQRVILAQMTGDMVKDAAMQARDQAKAEGKGFFSQWGNQLKATTNYGKRYFSMAPSAALNETPGNFALNNNGIHEVKLKLKSIDQGNTERHEFEIEFRAVEGKFEFRMDERNDYVQLLKQVYGERVKMPFGYFSSHGVRVKLF